MARGIRGALVLKIVKKKNRIKILWKLRTRRESNFLTKLNYYTDLLTAWKNHSLWEARENYRKKNKKSSYIWLLQQESNCLQLSFRFFYSQSQKPSSSTNLQARLLNNTTVRMVGVNHYQQRCRPITCHVLHHGGLEPNHSSLESLFIFP